MAFLPISCEPMMDRGSRMLISAALSVTDPINDRPEVFNNIYLGGDEDRNPFSVLFSRPEDAENLINFINQNWQMIWDWNISCVYRYAWNGLPYVVILPLFSQQGLIADCDQILFFISDLVNFPQEPVRRL